jgi:hypothetical protein
MEDVKTSQQDAIALSSVPICDDRLIGQIWGSRFYLPTLILADEIGVFPFLAKAPATSAETAEHCGLSPASVEIMLGLLAALRLLLQRQGRFALTDVSRTYLLPESPYYCVDALRALGHTPLTSTSLQDLLKKDRQFPIKQAWLAGIMSDEAAEKIAAAQYAHAWLPAMGMARHGDFSGVSRLLDVGGGPACLSIALAMHYTDMRFTVLELPAMCKQVERYVAMHGLQERIDHYAANMFDGPWPSGYDGILFSNVFHAWEYETNLKLARLSFEALPPGGKIFIHEMLLDETIDGPLGALSNSMCVFGHLGGRLYTAGELEKMLYEAGFEQFSVVSTFSATSASLVSASKPVAQTD